MLSYKDYVNKKIQKIETKQATLVFLARGMKMNLMPRNSSRESENDTGYTNSEYHILNTNRMVKVLLQAHEVQGLYWAQMVKKIN